MLSSGSHVKVECLCPDCEKEMIREYRFRNRPCKACSNKRRAGNKHYSFQHGNKHYSVYKSAAKKRGYRFKISVAEFEDIVSEPCHYCGDNGKVGIDRKDNTLGYLLNNCLPCCAICNRAKRDLPYDVFLNHIAKISEHLKET